MRLPRVFTDGAHNRALLGGFREMVAEESSFVIPILAFSLFMRLMLVRHWWYDTGFPPLITLEDERVKVVAASVEKWRRYIDVGLNSPRRPRFLITIDSEWIPRGMTTPGVYELVWDQLEGRGEWRRVEDQRSHDV